MKIVLYKIADEFWRYAVDKIYNFLIDGHEVFIYDVLKNNNDAKLAEIKHFQMYDNLFSFCKKINANVLFISNLLPAPEILYFSLLATNMKTKVVFIFNFRSIERSLEQAIVYKKLISLENTKYAILSTMLPVEKKYTPDKWKKISIPENKIIKINDTLDIDTKGFYINKETSCKYFNLEKNKFHLLFIGNDKQTKGLDILEESMKFLNANFKLVKSKDFGRLSYVELGMLYRASDAIILPYRILYKNGSSGVMPEAALAKRPIIAPNFYPFSEIIKRYKLGITFKAEDVIDLTKKIQKLFDNYEKICNNAKYEYYTATLSKWTDFAKIICKEGN